MLLVKIVKTQAEIQLFSNLVRFFGCDFLILQIRKNIVY